MVASDTVAAARIGLHAHCAEPTLEAKLQFLQSPDAYPGLCRPPTWLETHMSWVLFAGNRVFKLKKPIRFPWLDFTTLAARERNCREELRLNRRLAPDVYLDLVAMRQDAAGLALVPQRELVATDIVVDWLVAMRRLPPGRMLDRRIAARRVRRADIDALVELLARFYRDAARVAVSGREFVTRFQRDQAVNREILLRPQFRLLDVGSVLAQHDAALLQGAGLLRQRARSGHVVDGHGDLRPEHVCLSSPPVVIDCLEFNAAMRQVDPYGEIAFLALECDMAGAPWIGQQLVRGCTAAWGDPPPPALMHLLTAHHALVRARLAMAHLLDPQPRSPEKWPAVAQRYVDRAQQELCAIDQLGAAPSGPSGARNAAGPATP